MSETSLTLAELARTADDDAFFSRLGWLAAQILVRRYEGGFTVRKIGDTIAYSELLMPGACAENQGFDPARELSVDDILRPHGALDPQMSAFLHTHPGKPYGTSGYVAYPSHTDLELYRRIIYPVHPGHIGGILTVQDTGAFPYHLFLYRASSQFNPEALDLRPDEELTYEEAFAIPTMMQSAGLQTTTLLYGVDGRAMNKDMLARLYE